MKKCTGFLILLALALVLLIGCSDTVAYNINYVVDGEVIKTVEVSGSGAVELPEKPTKDGYIFDGWYYDDETWSKPFSSVVSITELFNETTSVYAKWSVDKSLCEIVSLEGAEIDGKEITLKVPYEQKNVEIAKLIKISEGATYVVTMDISGIVPLISGVVTPSEGENTYYITVFSADSTKQAQYTLNIERAKGVKIQYCVSIDGVKRYYSINKGDEIEGLPQPQKSGAIFKGWYVNGKEITFPYVPSETDVIVCEWAKSEELVAVKFNLRSGESFAVGEQICYVLKGQPLSSVLSYLPVLTKGKGDFKGWETKGGIAVNLSTVINREYDLYGVWENDTVEVRYYPNEGYFENEGDAVKEISYGSQIDPNNHPIPLRDGGYEFLGWYRDAALTMPIDPDQIYNENCSYYAKWHKMFMCVDGTYNHVWSEPQILTVATCEEGATVRYECELCWSPKDIVEPNGLGHKWSDFSELGVMQRLRSCTRTGCTFKEIQKFTDITFLPGVLPDNPAEAVSTDGSTMSIAGAKKIGAVVDGNWSNTNVTTFCGNSPSGTVVVTVTLATPTAMDRIYVKGYGAGSAFIIKVQYEGDVEPSRVGQGNFISFAEQEKDINEVAISFAEVDSSKKVMKVVVEMSSPSYGQDYWQEIGFAVIPEEYRE